MGYITIGILAYTAMAVIFGMIRGMTRGRRALLRLILVAVSAVLAVMFRGKVVEIIMDLNVGGGTVKEMLASAFTSGETALPESMQDLIFVIVEIILGLVAFYLIFIVLRFVSWLVIYSILKIVVKKGGAKEKATGALFGLIQGLLIAFIVCAPLTGFITQIDKLSKLEINGTKIIAVSEEVGIKEYTTSTPAKIYNVAGNWFFEMLTSKTDANGNKVTIDDTCDILVTVAGIADSVTELNGTIDLMTNEESTPQQRVDAIQSVGDKLVEIGNNINSMSGDAKTIVDGLISSVKDMVGGNGEESGELDEALDSFDLDNLDLVGAGNALNGIATYIEKTSPEFENEEAVTQEDVNKIISGLASNTFIIDMMGGGTGAIVETDDAHKAMFESAISETELTDEQKDTLRGILGIAVA